MDFRDEISLQTSELVLTFSAAVDQLPSWCRGSRSPIDPPPSTLTRYKSIRRPHPQMQAVIPNKSHAPIHPATTHFIPIWYGGDAGPDLVDVAQQADLTRPKPPGSTLSVTYRVYMLGFSPGFPLPGDRAGPFGGTRLPDTAETGCRWLPSASQERKPASTHRPVLEGGTHRTHSGSPL